MSGRLALALGVVAYLALNLALATHPWMPDALSEGLNLRHLAAADRALTALGGWLSSGGDFAPVWKDLTWQGFPYGPLLYLSAACGERLIGPGPALRLVPVLAGTALALWATWDMGRRLGASAGAGLWAAGITAALPMIQYSSRHFTTDTLVTGLSLAACAAALRSGGFGRWRPTLALGLALGLGGLAKPTVAHFTVAPLALYALWTVGLGRALVPGDEPPARLGGRLTAASPLLAAVAVALAVAWPYLHHFRYDYATTNIERFGLGARSMWGIEPWLVYPRFGHEDTSLWLLFYVRMLLRYQVGVPLLIVLGLGSAAAWRGRRPQLAWALLSFVLPLLLYSGMGVKKWYYTVPALPFAALAAGLGLDLLQRRRRVLGLALAAVVLSAGLWAGLGGAGLWFNQPRILHLWPRGEPLRGEQLGQRLVDELAASPWAADAVLLVDPHSRRRANTLDYARLYALLHQVHGVLARGGYELDLSIVQARDQLGPKIDPLPPGPRPRWVIYVDRVGAPWVDADASQLPGPVLGARDRERVADMARRVEPIATARAGAFHVTLSRVRR